MRGRGTRRAIGGAILWLRQDLRLRDNPALHAAMAHGGPVIPVYIWAPEDEGDWPPGGASRWWLHESLLALAKDLRSRGSRLTIARGPTVETLTAVLDRSGATAVYWNRRYEPAAAQCSKEVQKALAARGLQHAEFNATLLAEPEEILNGSGAPYLVYTPFRRKLLSVASPGEVLPLPRKLPAPARWPASLAVERLGLRPRLNWYRTMATLWRPGEAGAHANLRRFLASAAADYRRARELPFVRGTSRLSPHLHFGEIGARQLWHACRSAKPRDATFLHELVWREFAYHLLHHYPRTAEEPLRSAFLQFPWERNARQLRTWQRGMTGVPLVDAGMRELWASGWMHNRVRMVAASFLTKNLLIPWQQGARWFWDTLVDADLANNTLNWQWVAGCGADAAPYFRIFNPNSQAQRFDPGGRYIHRWVPELRRGAPGRYPHPIVDLRSSREAALRAYQSMKRASKDRGRL